MLDSICILCFMCVYVCVPGVTSSWCHVLVSVICNSDVVKLPYKSEPFFKYRYMVQCIASL